MENNVTNGEKNWYIDVSTGDLHLAFNNPVLVNQGLDHSSIFTDDIDKNSRPQGDEFDIRAHEFFIPMNTETEVRNDKLVSVYPNPCAGVLSISALNYSDLLI